MRSALYAVRHCTYIQHTWAKTYYASPVRMAMGRRGWEWWETECVLWDGMPYAAHTYFQQNSCNRLVNACNSFELFAAIPILDLGMIHREFASNFHSSVRHTHMQTFTHPHTRTSQTKNRARNFFGSLSLSQLNWTIIWTATRRTMDECCGARAYMNFQMNRRINHKTAISTFCLNTEHTMAVSRYCRFSYRHFVYVRQQLVKCCFWPKQDQIQRKHVDNDCVRRD